MKDTFYQFIATGPKFSFHDSCLTEVNRIQIRGRDFSKVDANMQSGADMQNR